MLPNQIWIKPKVVYERVYQELIGDDPKTIGYCDDPTKHIYIKLGLNPDEEAEVSIHELLHAITFHYKIKIAHKDLDKLAIALVKVLKLNSQI